MIDPADYVKLTLQTTHTLKQMNWKKTGHNNPTCQDEESQSDKYLACGDVNTRKDGNSDYNIGKLFETEEEVVDEHEPEKMICEHDIDTVVKMNKKDVDENVYEALETCDIGLTTYEVMKQFNNEGSTVDRPHAPADGANVQEN